MAAQGRARTREEIAGFFDGFTIIDPGLVWMPLWRPDRLEDVPEHPEKFWFLAGVGRLSLRTGSRGQSPRAFRPYPSRKTLTGGSSTI